MTARKSPKRHPTGGLVPTGPPRRRFALSGGWIAILVMLGLIFVGLRVIGGSADEPQESGLFTDKVVVVGTTGHDTLTADDEALLGTHLDDAQVGLVNVRGRYLPDCAAAGWTTLGAGRRAAVGGLCDPPVASGRITDWAARQAAAAARNGDARLGTLADSVQGCVAAVGPGAALAAAKPDGTVAAYQTVDAFVAAKYALTCPFTIIDAGPQTKPVVDALAKNTDVTLIVTGIGPAAGSDDRSLQVIYRLGTTLPGWLTSASTRREGVVTLTDLTRTLIDFGNPKGHTPPSTVDGAPLTVVSATLTVARIKDRIAEVAALSDAVITGYLVTGAIGIGVVLVGLAGLLFRRWRLTRLAATVGLALGATMMLVGAYGWQRAGQPRLALSIDLVVCWAVVASLALLLARWLRIPAAYAVAGLSVAAFTIDAALGGPMQPGSMLNSRPIFGLRWYGFGNVTFAVYATFGLLLAGYVAQRFRADGRRAASLIAVAAIGFGIVICEGWPTMGTDFGGVVALTPAVLWLLLALSGLRVTVPRLLVVGGGAVVAIGLISVLDWARGPDRRSHLGNFVQRILDGDAYDVVSRKAVASVQTLLSPLGIGSVVIGVALWILIFRYALPRLAPDIETIRPTMIAVLVVAILGTVLNDGGVSVWYTASGTGALAVGWLLLDQRLRERAAEVPSR